MCVSRLESFLRVHSLTLWTRYIFTVLAGGSAIMTQFSGSPISTPATSKTSLKLVFPGSNASNALTRFTLCWLKCTSFSPLDGINHTEIKSLRLCLVQHSPQDRGPPGSCSRHVSLLLVALLRRPVNEVLHISSGTQSSARWMTSTLNDFHSEWLPLHSEGQFSSLCGDSRCSNILCTQGPTNTKLGSYMWCRRPVYCSLTSDP